MAQDRTTERDRGEAHLVGAAWEELTEPERNMAIAIAGREGGHAVQKYLGVLEVMPASVATLRRSPWAREQGGLEGLSDDSFLLFASAHTVPSEDNYIESVVEPLCPERAWWWWGSEPEERRADPRVWAFCDAYERERCSILEIAPPPTEIVDLQLQLWQAKEQERERARDWLRTLEISYSTEEYGETQRSVAKFEYQRCQWITDLALMMLAAATSHGPREQGNRAT